MPRRNGASWGSNITLSWLRQTRVGGEEWFDFASDVPLAEDAEAYDLEILDGQGGAVLLTEIGITSPSFVYTTAMQTADFAMDQTELTRAMVRRSIDRPRRRQDPCTSAAP